MPPPAKCRTSARQISKVQLLRYRGSMLRCCSLWASLCTLPAAPKIENQKGNWIFEAWPTSTFVFSTHPRLTTQLSPSRGILGLRPSKQASSPESWSENSVPPYMGTRNIQVSQNFPVPGSSAWEKKTHTKNLSQANLLRYLYWERTARVTLWALVVAVPREAPFSFSEPLWKPCLCETIPAPTSIRWL